MDLHKPKPWHNWREFLKELGTIAQSGQLTRLPVRGPAYYNSHQRGLK